MHAILKEISDFQTLPQNKKDEQALAMYKKVEKSSLSKQEKADFVTSLHATQGLRNIQQYNSQIANSWGLEFVYINPVIRMSPLLPVYAVVSIASRVVVSSIVSIPGAVACLFKRKVKVVKK